MLKFTFIQSTFLILLSASLGLFAGPASVAAWFGDTETATDQQFGASTLQLVVVPPSTSVPASGATAPVTIGLTPDSIAAQYDIVAVESDSAHAFCSTLAVTFSTDDGVLLDQASGFVSGLTEVSPTWNLGFTSDQSPVIETSQTCTVTFAVTAWQANMEKESAGFRDNTTFSVVVTVAPLADGESLPLRLATETPQEIAAPQKIINVEISKEPKDENNKSEPGQSEGAENSAAATGIDTPGDAEVAGEKPPESGAVLLLTPASSAQTVPTPPADAVDSTESGQAKESEEEIENAEAEAEAESKSEQEQEKAEPQEPTPPPTAEPKPTSDPAVAGVAVIIAPTATPETKPAVKPKPPAEPAPKSNPEPVSDEVIEVETS